MIFRPAKDYVVNLYYLTPGTKGAEIRLSYANKLIAYTWEGAGGFSYEIQSVDHIAWAS